MVKDLVLVTGGTGLVGNGIRLALTEKNKCNTDWLFASSKDVNLLNEEETLSYFNTVKPTHVIHLAARVGGLFANMEDNIGFFNENMTMNMNVLKASEQIGVKRLVCCLSTCIFPDKITYPINETMLHLGPPHNSNYGYSYAKRMVDVMCRGYNEKFGTDFITFIPTNVYGPFDNFNLQNGHVIPSLIHKAYLRKGKNEPLEVMGSGKALRQFIYSVDLGRLIVWMTYNYFPKDSSPIILSVPEEDEMSIFDAASKIAEYSGVTAGVKVQNVGSDGQFKKTASTEKLQSILKDFKFTPFEEAIKFTCNWFSENFQTLRK